MGDESVRSHVPESLEELSGEWMRQQLQEAAVNTGPPPQERKAESAPRPSWSHTPVTTPAAPVAGPAASAEPDSGLDDVLAGLAQSVSQAVVSAVSQLEHRRTTEKLSLERTVSEQEQVLRSTQDRVTELQARVDGLTQALEHQKGLASSASDSYERLVGEIGTIHRRDSDREAILEALRRETLDLSVSVSDRQDQVSGRLEMQNSAIESLKVEVAQLRPAFDQANERLSRHSAALRAVFEAERQREEALERLTEAASGLKRSALRMPEGLSEELL